MNEQAFRNLVSGKTGGLVAGVLRHALQALSVAYRFSVALRNKAFDKGWKAAHRVEVPVISVGNLTTGGTGKTPVVALIVHALQAMNLQPGIISRGYGSVNDQPNDEKLVLQRICPGVPHEQNRSRYAAAKKLPGQSEVNVIVMDDGFQHRALHRDLDIVLIDATNPFGYEYLLPRGLLREPVTSLRRAHMVLITRADMVPEAVLRNIEQAVTAAAQHLKDRIFSLRFQPTGLIDSAGKRISLSEMADEPTILVSGIGNPEAFQKTCIQAGVRVSDVRWFPDHHRYSPDDEKEIQKLSESHQNARILTTLKDMVKLSPRPNLWALETQAEFLHGKDTFESTLVSLCTLAGLNRSEKTRKDHKDEESIKAASPRQEQ